MMRKRKNKKHGFSKKKIIYGITAVAVIAAGVFLGFHLLAAMEFKSFSGNRAVIVDQLSASMPNPIFVEKATNLLMHANFTVDYYPSEAVTVDFYRNLPTLGYDLIILRAHSTVANSTGKFLIFTSEQYSKNKYQYEQLTDRVGHVKVRENSTGYFGIYPSFVTSSMKGNFRDAIVVMMGCGGTLYASMAEAFIEKGARVYFGWDERVDIGHSDTATLCLLNHLIIQNETIGEAVDNTMKEVGSDPTYDSNFLCYVRSVDTLNTHIID